MTARNKYSFYLLFLIGFFVFSSFMPNVNKDTIQIAFSKIESFSFLSNGITTTGKIFLPDSYDTNQNLPAIFLIDYSEQHFKTATDEFEMVINAVKQIDGFEALVVSLNDIPDIDTKPKTFQEQYEIFKNMVNYVNNKYTSNLSNTFIGRGSESSIVLMTLFLENSETSLFDNFVVTDPSPLFTSTMVNIIEKRNFPKNKRNKKLHFSFSTSNNHENCTKIMNMINSAQFPWLQFESIEYSNNNFENTYPIAFASGLEFIFNK